MEQVFTATTALAELHYTSTTLHWNQAQSQYKHLLTFSIRDMLS